MLNLSQGNSYELQYTVKNSDGTLKDLSGSLQIRYELAKARHKQPLIAYDLTGAQIVIVDAVNGRIDIKIPSTDLNNILEGSYYHEIWQVNAVGEPTTLMSEDVSISSKLIKG